MRFSLAAILAVSVVLADSESSEAAQTGMIYLIFIEMWKMTPQELQAAAGDTVHFEFSRGMHSIAQVNFDFPCQSKKSEAFEIQITVTEPLWFYNAMLDPCHEESVLGVINPSNIEGMTYSDFVAKAKQDEETAEAERNGGTIIQLNIED
ncbi:hypothetical protein BROUX41_006140 [Berkeleyomyces rouxiae]|uniref:uncharacterized protein n=1 Tax=Berkeleyomyces rouxiae TaxID=2035830 RepID=UPI003B76EE06